ncbi:MAG: cell division protein FtsX [Proteobacteria bacterium]|nr:MAG: cell division protein FtsX [Pseudomonadota bacterium]
MSAWIVRHLQTLVGSLGRLSEHALATLLTTLVIGIALALPACLYVLVANAQVATGTWQRAVDLTVYLERSATADAARSLAERVRARRDVAAVELITKEEALKEFRSDSGFGASLDALADNPLPHTLVVRPGADYASAEHLEGLAADLRALEGVEVVQLDTLWVSRLEAILETVRRGALIAAALLAIGVLVIVGNTIRLDIQNRRQEIEVTKLVGGSDGFVRRPFLYSGVWYGLGGGLVAWLVTTGVVAALAGPVSRLAGLYESAFRIQGLRFDTGLALLGAGIALGWLGSFIAATRHLRDIEP